jgi:hypothetical protein
MNCSFAGIATPALRALVEGVRALAPAGRR